jgi:phosphoglycerol transferase MdoB-like AlkP superfamily enzyme
VDFTDWMLALHLISAFAVASSLVLFSVLVFSGRRMTTLDQTRTLFRVAPVGNLLITAGLGLVLLFGVILSVSRDFEIWDGWIIAAIILFAAFGGVGQRSGAYYTDVQKLAEGEGNEAEVLARLRAPTGAMLHLATVALFVLIVLDMIWKPGA